MFGCFLNSQKSKTGRKRVLMTGYGPFSELGTNPSWEGVKFMDKEVIEERLNIFLSRKEIPVRYGDVDRIVPELWDACQPDLTIHVGVSEAVSCFVLETRANKYGYEYPDVDEVCPAGYQNACDGPDSIATVLDVEAVCEKFNDDPPAGDLQAKISSDAGQYLCEYIYYTSLYHGRSPTLFVHVPLEKYTTEELAQGLECILELCLEQLSRDDYYDCSVIHVLHSCFLNCVKALTCQQWVSRAGRT